MIVEAGLFKSFCSAIGPDSGLTLISVELFQGPNLYADRESAVCRLESSATRISAKALRERLQEAFPGSIERSRGAAKGRADATAVAACVADLAAGLLHANGTPDAASGSRGEGETAVAWIEHSSSMAGLQALKTSLAAVAAALATGEEAQAVASLELQKLEAVCALLKPNFDAGLMIAAARRRNLPYLRLGHHKSVWQFGWGCRSERFWVTASNADGMVAQRISRDKELSKRFLRQLGIPTPDSRVIRPQDDFRPAVSAIGWPCAIKPLTGGAGRGVTAGINDMSTAEQAVGVARKTNPNILVEQHVPGDDHRLMVIDGKLAAAVKRTPPAVVGNGKTNIADLVDAFNQKRRNGTKAARFLEPVPLDDALVAALASQGVDTTYIPARGEKVLLRTAANRSSGGTCEDVTALVHPQIREMAQHCAAAFGFRAAGIDYITPDISRSFEEVGGGVLELNTTPGARVLLAAGIDPDEIGSWFLGSKPGRIPVVVLVAPEDLRPSIETDLVQRLSRHHGLATSASARIGDCLLANPGRDAPSCVATLLSHPAVERLVVLWTPEDVQTFGLPVDSLDDVILLDGTIGDAWSDVLRQHSRKLHVEKSVPKAIAAALGPE